MESSKNGTNEKKHYVAYLNLHKKCDIIYSIILFYFCIDLCKIKQNVNKYLREVGNSRYFSLTKINEKEVFQVLQLLSTDVDICRISKMLGRQRIKSSITNSTIIIETDEISDDVVDMLFANATIISAQNYRLDESEVGIDTEIESKHDDESSIELPVEQSETPDTSETDATGDAFVEIPIQEVVEISEGVAENGNNETSEVKAVGEAEVEVPTSSIAHDEELSDETIDSEYYVQEQSNMLSEFDIETESEDKPTQTKILKSEMVYRGEVYKWGSIRNDDDREGKIKECVIIIQNDYQNSASDDTIALFCTTHYEERAPIHFSFQFTQGTMIDHSTKRLELFDHCTFFIGRIKGISRKQLGKYLGTMNDMFMNTLQPTVDFCLGLKRSRTVNWAQLQILSTVNMEDLFRISESKVSDKRKVEEFLELFSFDMSCNGMEYVKEAILVARKLGDYRLEYLAEIIAKRQNVDANEVLRLIVARIKENFHFKKSPAISFIRLIDRLLKKG